jgi:hypothetical protein
MNTKAIKTILSVIIPVCMLACASQSHPVFNSAGDREEAPEIPCANAKQTGFVVGWHRCHQKDPQGKIGENGEYNCCADGYACGEDEFMPRHEHICVWRGMEEMKGLEH